jgi:exodeoxyribonuclease III
MKIATFNINNVGHRLPNLLSWLRESEPDVVCLQELKQPDALFPDRTLREAGYRAVWQGQKTYNGVAILAKGADPVLTRRGLPGDAADAQSRYVEAAVNGMLIASIYAPNGNPQPGPKFDCKLAWFDRLIRHAKSLYPVRSPVVLAGASMSFRPIGTFTRRGPGRRTRCCNRRAGPPFSGCCGRDG